MLCVFKKALRDQEGPFLLNRVFLIFPTTVSDPVDRVYWTCYGRSMFYQDVFKAFDENNIRYVVVGAIAMNLHGAPRMTADLDILADLEGGNLANLLETVHALGYRPRLPVSPRDLLEPDKRHKWIKEKGLVAFTFFHSKLQYQEIDLLLESPVSFDSADQAKTVILVESIRIPVISIDHLIQMKRLTGREQDQADIQTLERIKHLKSGKANNA